ncbi:MAG: YceI family protein [Acidimicrobiales bacterium]
MTTIEGLTPGVWKIDPAHTTAEFSVRHLMVTKVRGRFSDVGGAVTIADDPLRSKVEAVINTASITTGDGARDNHLRTADFLEVEKYPEMTFTSTEILPKGSEYVVRGDLTLHGVTKPVELTLEFNGVAGDPWGGTRAGFSAETEINRRDFGVDISMPMDGGGVVVGDKIKIQIEAEVIKT